MTAHTFQWTRVLGLSAWAALCLAATALFVRLDIQDAEQKLIRQGDTYADQLNQEMVASETIVMGFSALFGSIGSTEPEIARRYADQVIALNRHIFSLEIVQEVPAAQRAAFEMQQQQELGGGFRIRSFSYDTDRQWQPVADKALYYPIVFMHPMPPESRPVLGLDIDSVPHLRMALLEALHQRKPVATLPFVLVQGQPACAIFYPIPRSPNHAAGNSFVDLVIDANRLSRPLMQAGENILVHHSRFAAHDRKGQLLAVDGDPRSRLETALFPVFQYHKTLAGMGESYVLRISRQLGWSDLNLWVLLVLGLLTLLSTLAVNAYLRMQQRDYQQQEENQKRLWLLANHDPLTGLPNRLMLMRHLRTLQTALPERIQSVAILFLDLDNFKQINDSFGHQVGDQLLKYAGRRLKVAVRSHDTVARISGDEFVIVLENLSDPDILCSIMNKIRSRMAEGFHIGDQRIDVRASMGMARYPQDGDSLEGLVIAADQQMYQDKQQVGSEIARPRHNAKTGAS